jgi:hypothetical protein
MEKKGDDEKRGLSSMSLYNAEQCREEDLLSNPVT